MTATPTIQVSNREAVRYAILTMGAIRHVRISSDDEFFVVKYPGVHLEWAQELGEKLDEWAPSPFPIACITEHHHRRYACYILHKGKLIYRESSHSVLKKSALSDAGFDADTIFEILSNYDQKIVSPTEAYLTILPLGLIEDEVKFMFPDEKEKILKIIHEPSHGEVDDGYLEKYWKQIENSPEFQLESMFTAKLKERGATESELKQYPFLDATNTFKETDYLIPRVGVKIASPKHWRPVADLLREYGLLKETRGKVKPVDADTKYFKKFLLNEFRSMGKKKPLPITKLKKKLAEEVLRRIPDDAAKADRYQWSDATIRRLIQPSIKK